MVVVIARIEQSSGTCLLVAPISHTAPRGAGEAIEIPTNVKKQLGLDREKSWIILTELNRFLWPGPDIRPVAGSDNPFYDALPDWLFAKVRDGVVHHFETGRLKMTKRTE